MPFLQSIKSKLAGIRELYRADRGKFWRSVAVATTTFLAVSFVAVIFFGGDTLRRLAPTQEAKAFSLVNEKISQGADIIINVPPFATLEEAKAGMIFEPNIEGSWIPNAETGKLVFRPSRELKIGNYFTAIASTTGGVLKEDFKIVEKPAIISVFPKSGAEASEKSEITIIFNQAMVPLATLDKLGEKDIPVEISPATKGRFKWQGTRTLQFIPEKGLVVSANYTVSVKQGFVSMDGLAVAGGEFNFSTRHLCGGHEGSSYLINSSPAKFRFNQPIDIERSRAEIVVRASGTGEAIPFVAEYGKKDIVGKQGKKSEEEDKTLLHIYRANDKFGRAKRWNFNEKFSIEIKKAHPLGGDIIMDTALKTDFTVLAEMSSIIAESERSLNTSLDVFDPSGSIVATFFEDVDLEKSEITAPGLREIKYGEKCKDESAEYPNCEKVDNRKTIRLYFDAEKIGRGQRFDVVFDKIANAEGLTISGDPIKKTVTSFGNLSFEILAGENTRYGKLDSLSQVVVCSNNPLRIPDKSDFSKEKISGIISADNDFSFVSWGNSVLVTDKKAFSNFCDNGLFETVLNIRLQPEKDYKLKLSISDQFGQEGAKEAVFRTGKMKEKFLNFYHFQKKYSITTPDKTVLTYAGENMEFVDMQICRLAPQRALELLAFPPAYMTPSEKVTGCAEKIDKRIELPKKYWTMNYFKIDLKDYVDEPLGHYMLTFTNPQYFDRTEKKNRVYERSYVSVTNLGVVAKQIGSFEKDYEGKPSPNALKNDRKAKISNLYWVTKLGTMEPVVGAQIDLYAKKSRDFENKAIGKLASAKTGIDGIGKTGIVEQPFGAVVTSGKDSAIVSNAENKLSDAWDEAQNRRMTYLYTDRPIYRPSQTVYFKGIYRIGYDGDYEIFRDKKAKVQVFDAENKMIFERESAVSEYGTFAGEFILPEKAPLGGYRIEAEGNAYYFDVEEYVPSAFKVGAKTDKSEYLNGEEFKLGISAEYYFGAKLEGGELEYSVASQDYYFDKYKGDYFPFGSAWYSCWEDCYFGDKFLFRGQGKLDAEGKAEIARKISLDDYFKPEERKSKIITIYYTIKNSNGQAVSGQQSFILHAASYYLGVKSDKNFLGKGESFNLSVKSVDTEGGEVEADGLKLRLSKVEWKHSRRQEVDGGFYYRWERSLVTVQERDFKTDVKGDWRETFSINEEGEYEVEVSGVDAKGNKSITRTEIYIYGDGEVAVRTGNDSSLDIVLDDDSLAVGEKGRTIIKSPFKRAKALLSIERGEIYEYRIIDVDKNIFEYSFDIKEKYVPSAYVSAVLISTDPDLKYGSVSFNVGKEGRKLQVDIKANKESYLPGEEVVLDVMAKDSDGRGVESEVSIAAADLSVLALKGNPKKDPVSYFFDYFPLTVFTSSNIKNVLVESDFYIVPGKGGGGVDPEDLARKKRGVFKDTAFWKADVRTGKDGQATVKFALPDNLTTWQAEAVAVTRDTKLGAGYREFLANKPVMAVPLVPRFILPGDEFMAGAKISNQTKESQELSVEIMSDSLGLPSEKRSVRIGAGETSNVYFKAKAPLGPFVEHKFAVTAKNDRFEDAVDGAIPVSDNEIYETFSTFGMTKDSSLREYAYIDGTVDRTRGGVDIRVGKTLSGYLAKAVDSLLEYPYGCSEQIASKLEGVAIAKRYAAIYGKQKDIDSMMMNFNGTDYAVKDGVSLAMSELAIAYTVGGGFSYYPGGEPDAYLTMKIAGSLKSLKDAGYQVNDTIMSDLCSSAEYIFMDASRYGNDKDSMNDAIILASEALRCNEKMIAYVKNIRRDKAYLNEKASNVSLAALALLLNDKRYGDEAWRNEVLDIIESRLEIDARGASLRPNGRLVWPIYENTTKDTALALSAISASKREGEMPARMANWLLRSRDKDGAWGTTDATVEALEAMSAYVAWQKESDSEFAVRLQVNGSDMANLEFGKDSEDFQELFVPMANLRFGEMNDVLFAKTDAGGRAGNMYYDMSLKYYFPAEGIKSRDEGFVIERGMCRFEDGDCVESLASAKAGDVLRVRLKIIVPKVRNFVAIEDFIPAGTALINENLLTEDRSLRMIDEEKRRMDCEADPINCADYFFENEEMLDRPMKLYADREEKRDDRLFVFRQRLEAGIYEYDYYIRALVPGKFQHLPARISEMYFPENFGRTAGGYFEIKEK